MEKLLPSFIHLISYHLRNVTHWTFSFTLSTAGHSYLYSRNPWCAIFPVNPRQTLEQQANRSVDLIWRRLRTPPLFLFFSPFHLRYLLFCQQLLVGPWYLGCPAEDKYPHCIRQRTSGFPVQILSNFSLFFVPFISVHNLTVIVGLKKKNERKRFHTLSPISPASPGGPWGPSSPCDRRGKA